MTAPPGAKLPPAERRSVVRTVGMIVLGLAFVVLAPALLVAHATLGVVGDADDLVALARDAELREAAVAVITDAVWERAQEKIDEQGGVEASDRERIATMVSEAITDPWIEQTLRALHDSIGRAGRGKSKRVAVSLVEVKTTLRSRLLALEGEAEALCRERYGEARCRDPRARELVRKAYRRQVATTMTRIPDELDLGKPAVAAARDLALVRSARLPVFVALAILWLAVVAAAAHARGRGLRAGGVVLCLAAALCLVAAVVISSLGSVLTDDLVGRLQRASLPEASRARLEEALGTLVDAFVSEVTTGIWLPALIAAAAGAALIAAGAFRARRPTR